MRRAAAGKNLLFVEAAADGTVGGSHSCLYNLVTNLDRERFNVSVLFYEPNLYVEKLEREGIPVHVLGRKPSSCRWAPIRKAINWYRLVHLHDRAVRRLLAKDRIDLVVLNNSIYVGVAMTRICSKLGIPVVSYERGYAAYREQHLEASRSLSAAIPVSRWIQENMKKQRYRAPSTVIYDGIPVGRGKGGEPKADLKRQLGIPEDGIVIAIAGNVREWKGHEYFVRAFMELAARRPGLYGLVIGGHGEPDREYHDRIRSEAGSSEAGRRLLFLGYRPDLDDLYRVMDVFVHASIRPEPFGMVILEAMFNRVPVVATGIGGPVEILENGNCGILVTPGSVGEITEGVEKYLDDPHFTECTVQKAYDRVIGLFNVGRTVTCTQELFLHVMDGDHGRRSMPIQTERRSYEDRQIDERLHC